MRRLALLLDIGVVLLLLNTLVDAVAAATNNSEDDDNDQGGQPAGVPEPPVSCSAATSVSVI